MKKNMLLILCMFLLQNCKTVKNIKVDQNFEGIYKKKGSSVKLELTEKGLYTLYNSKDLDHFVIEQCEYASKGQWKNVSSDIIDLTSENYYLKQEGFKYDLKQELKYSKDSIYIDIILPKDFEEVATPEFDFLFNYNTSKSINTLNNKIKLSKKDYSLIGVKNQIIFDLVFNAKGNVFFNNRLRYNILQDYNLDTDKYNYFTISLPHFNQCFYDFEPYYHNYIYVKDKNTLMWKGEEWIRQ